MRKLIFILLISLFALSCGKTTGFEAKVNNETVLTEIKTGIKGTTEFVDTGGAKTAMHIVGLYNADFTPNYPGQNHWDQALKDAGQVKIQFTIYGEKGKSDKTTPLKVGTYSSSSATDNNLGIVGIITVADSKEDKQFVHFGSKQTDKGEVKITNVTDETIEGEIDAVGKGFSKEISVKGKFTAKIQKAR